MADQAKNPSADRKRDDTVIDHVADLVTEAPEPEGEQQHPLTPTGQPVEDQVQKKWEPNKEGGLPTFFPLRKSAR